MTLLLILTLAHAGETPTLAGPNIRTLEAYPLYDDVRLELGKDKRPIVEVREDSTIVTNPLVTWTSSNPAVVTVNAAGMIHPVAIGKATLTATSGTASRSWGVEIVPLGAPGAEKYSLALPTGLDGGDADGVARLNGGSVARGDSTAPKGEAKIDGDPVIVGALDRSAIDPVIQQKMLAIQFCYQDQLDKYPGLEGKVTVKLTIAEDGTVASVVTENTTLGNAVTENCLNRRFRYLVFPSPTGGVVTASYRFAFSPPAK